MKLPALLTSLAISLTSARADDAPLVRTWTPLFNGISHGSFQLKEPRLIRAEVLKIDLAAKGLQFLTTPDNGARDGETDAITTSTFLTTEKCQAAINAAPFDKVYATPGGPENVQGLMRRNNQTISPPDGQPCLAITASLTASIHHDDHGAPESATTVVSGFAVILRDGTITGKDSKLHPRTGAGVSADGKTLWLITIDGRQSKWSGGATTPEMAAWLQSLGADDAINLDGGGTTTMVVASPDGKPRILNRPIHLGIPGRERPSGSHLGILASPLTLPEN
jgi:hypothetical protein